MAGPKVLIGIPSLMVKVGFTPFDICLDRLMQGMDSTYAQVFRTMGGVVVRGRNEIVREAFRREAEYIWFLDDDQPFHPGGAGRPSDLDALLARQVEAVFPLSCRRGAPFLPLLYDHIDAARFLASQRYLLDHESGLIKVAGGGMAGLLIKTSVLRQMGTDGWFEFKHPPDNFDDYAEDFPFYRKLADQGVQLYCDLDVRFGHEFTGVAFIVKQQGKWVTVLADAEPFVAMPQPAPPADKLVFPSPAEMDLIGRRRA